MALNVMGCLASFLSLRFKDSANRNALYLLRHVKNIIKLC